MGLRESPYNADRPAKQLDSVFKCLEPVSGKDSDEGRNRRPFGNLMLNAKSDWFRVYKVG